MRLELPPSVVLLEVVDVERVGGCIRMLAVIVAVTVTVGKDRGQAVPREKKKKLAQTLLFPLQGMIPLTEWY